MVGRSWPALDTTAFAHPIFLRVTIHKIFAVVLLAVFSVGCRQPDGVVPPLDEEDLNRISDLGRDLEGVAGGAADARQAFAADLAVLADEHDPDAMAAVKGFAERLGDAVASRSLTGQAAQEIARTGWNLIGVTDLSDRQVKALQADLRTQLTGAGVPPDRADAIVAEMPSVQRAVTTRPRRWYEVF